MDGLSASTAGVPRGRRPLESGDESASKRIKREKAAERQRRKRERDRTAAVEAMMSYSAPPNPNHHHHHHHHIPGQQPGGQAASSSAGTTTTGPPGQLQSASFAPQTGGHDLAAEVARRERVRAAARERQRKHRQLVKERKLRAMGIDLDEMVPSHHPPPPSGGGGGGGGSADGNNGHGPFHHVLPPEMQGHASHGAPPPPHPPPPPDAFPHALGQLSGGRLFASTILLSFSCDPLLKVNLMRTLGMTHDELASLEPVIAEAWEHWDHQRRLHGAAANGSSGVTGGAPNGPHPFTSPPPTNGDPTHNEFRTRFRNSIEVPPPFAAYAHSAAANPPVQTPSTHGGGGGPSEDSIDPELADQSRPAAAGTGANDGKTAAGGVGGPKAGAPSSSSSNNKTGVPTIDPNLALKKES